jgi:hypothetical protein
VKGESERHSGKCRNPVTLTLIKIKNLLDTGLRRYDGKVKRKVNLVLISL